MQRSRSLAAIDGPGEPAAHPMSERLADVGAPQGRHRVLRGVGAMAFAMSCIAIVDGMAKFLAVDLHGVQVAWTYFVAILLNFVLYHAVFSRRRGQARSFVRAQRPALQVIRALCLVMSLSCLFVSLRYLGLAHATVVSFTAPLFVVALAGPLLAEAVPWQRWAAVGTGLLGAVLVVRPGTDVFQWAALLPLLGAVFFALFHVITRKIGNADPPATTVFHTFAIGALLLTFALPAVWRSMDLTEIAIAYLCGVLGLLAHGAMVHSLILADASTLAPLNYVRLLWALAIGYVVFGEVPDWLTLAGGAVIIASGLYVVYAAAKSDEIASRSPADPPEREDNPAGLK